MKKYILMLAMLFFLSSCGRENDYVIDLSRETESVSQTETEKIFVIINKNSGTFHLDVHCSYLSRMREENGMELYVKSLDKLFLHGYQPCGKCAEAKDIETNILP